MEQVKLKELGQSLRFMRVGKGMTLDDVAGEMKCSRQQINNIETGEVSYLSRVFIKYCTFLDVNIIFDMDQEVYQLGVARLAHNPLGSHDRHL